MPSLARVLLLSVGAAAVVGVGAVGIAAATADDTVARGVRVLGTDLGGADRAEAERRVTEALAPLRSNDVLVRADDVQVALDPAEAGLEPDPAAVVEDAFGGGAWGRISGVLGVRRDVTPVGTVDTDALRTALEEMAEQVDREPREGNVVFDKASPVAVLPLTGRTLDVDGAVELVAEEWITGEEPLELPLEVLEVTTTEEDVQQALTEVATPAVAAPVQVKVGDKTLALAPEALAAGLRFTADDAGDLRSSVDGKALLEAVGDRVQTVEKAPVDARIVIRDGAPVVVPSETGLVVNPEALAAAVEPVLTDPAPREVAMELVSQDAELTTEAARALGVKEEIASYTSAFPCCRPRVTNIRRIAALVDDTLVLPGETFSLNGAVGRRTAAKGFVAAPQILDGEFVDDIGGGVSQFATTMYNASFFAGLEDVEHKAHSYYITRYPEGREATVFFPSVDLKWRNDSEQGVLITTSSTGTSVTVTLWGTKRYDIRAIKGPRTNIKPFEKRYVQRDDCTAAAGHVGFEVTVTRVFSQEGKEVKREKVRTRYLPEPNFICGPPPSRKPAPKPASPAPASPAPASPAPASPAPAA